MRLIALMLRVLALAAACFIFSPGALAVPDEIQVYTDDLDDPGRFGLELHVNYALNGAKEPAYPGEMLSNHRLQVTPEFSYGLSKTLEAGLYLPAAMSSDGSLYGNGLRLRLKFVAPHEQDARFFCGLNVEIGSSARRVSDSRTGLELRPIIGYHDERWLVSFNPILDTDLSSGVSNAPKFEPALKVRRKVSQNVSAGLEYYGEYGAAHDLLPANERAHYLYAVTDVDLKDHELNLGLGHGRGPGSDQWVAKAIIAFPFR